MKHNTRAATFGHTHRLHRAYPIVRDLIRGTYPRRTYTGTGHPDGELISLAARLRHTPNPRRDRRLTQRATRNIHRAASEHLPYWYAHGKRSKITWNDDSHMGVTE